MTGDQRTPDRGRGQVARNRLTGILAEQADRIFLLFIVAVCGFTLAEASGSDFGALSAPGPALWPTVVSVVTAGTAVLALWWGREAPESVDRRSFTRVIGCLGAFLLFLLLYDFAGFVPASALALLIILRWVCGENWLPSVLTASLGSVGTYSLFGLALQVPLTGFGS